VTDRNDDPRKRQEMFFCPACVALVRVGYDCLCEEGDRPAITLIVTERHLFTIDLSQCGKCGSELHSDQIAAKEHGSPLVGCHPLCTMRVKF